MTAVYHIYAGTDKSFTVTVSNGTAPVATQNFTLTILDTPYIEMAGLSNGTVGEAYSYGLAALGGGTITWSISSGTLPAGLNLSGSTISGTPTTAGDSTFTLMATNANGSDTASYTVTINAAPTYGIGLSQSGSYTFAAQTAGYSPVAPLSVTVSNTGNQPTGALSVALSGTNAGSFTLSTGSIGSIATGSNNSFTVMPNTGLSIGTYTATVTVTADHSVILIF